MDATNSKSGGLSLEDIRQMVVKLPAPLPTIYLPPGTIRRLAMATADDEAAIPRTRLRESLAVPPGRAFMVNDRQALGDLIPSVPFETKADLHDLAFGFRVLGMVAGRAASVFINFAAGYERLVAATMTTAQRHRWAKRYIREEVARRRLDKKMRDRAISA